jgi:hypothetical protein
MSNESKKRVLLSIKAEAKKWKGEDLKNRLAGPFQKDDSPNPDPVHEASEAPKVEDTEHMTGLEASDEPTLGHEVPGETPEHEASELPSEEHTEDVTGMELPVKKTSLKVGVASSDEKNAIRELLKKIL